MCVHGGLDRGGSFARIARRLDRFDVVAYDRRGYQRSRGLTPISFDGHVADLVALARRERPRPVILFGHSFGGLVTFASAIRHPDLASLVVNFETPLPWVLVRRSGRPAPGDDPAAEAEQFFRRIMGDAAWGRLSEAERESRRADGPALLADLAVVSGPAPFDLGDLATPAALAYGDGHLGPYYRDLSVRLGERYPSLTTLEVAHAGHGAHLGSPGALAHVIERRWDDTCASD